MTTPKNLKGRERLVAPDNITPLGSFEEYDDTLLIYLCWSTDFYDRCYNHFCQAVEYCIPDRQKFSNVIVLAWPDEICDIASLLMLEGKAHECLLGSNLIILYNNDSKNPETFSTILENTTKTIWVGVNYFAFRCYYLYRDYHLEWNPQSNRALWLVGNPSRCERLVPFYMLANSGFLEKHFTYSFRPDYCSAEIGGNWIQNASEIIQLVSAEYGEFSDLLLKSSDDLDYAEWASKYTKELDITLGATQYDGTVYDLDLYRQHCAEFIIESRYDTPWFRTEKTYRGFALGYPVFLFGTHFIKRLQQDGYRTFERYVEWDYNYPDYFPYFDESQNYVTETHKIIKAIPEFLQVCKDPQTQQEIRQDIEHNKQHLADHVQNAIAPAQIVIPDISDVFFQSVHKNKN